MEFMVSSSVGVNVVGGVYNSGIFDNYGCGVGGVYSRIGTNTRSSIRCFVGCITCSLEFVVSSGVNVVGMNVVGGVYSSGIFNNFGHRCCVGGAYGRIRNFTYRSIGCFVRSIYSTCSMEFVVSSCVGVNVVCGIVDGCWSNFNGWRPSGTESFPE